MLAVNLKPTVGPAKAPAAGRPLWSRDCEDMVLPLMLSPYSRPRPSRNKAPGPSPVPGALVRPAAS